MRTVAVTLSLTVLAGTVLAQAPAGLEFQVNAFTTGDQAYPAATAMPGGSYLVTWTGQDGGGLGVAARRLDAAGVAVGTEFVVNPYTTGDQIEPSIAVTPEGRFLIAWTSSGQDGSASGVYARGGSAGGTLGPEFQVNAFTSQEQSRPRVAAIPGGFLVVWQSEGQDGWNLGVFGRLYDLSAAPVGSEFQLSVATSGDQIEPVAVGMADGGYAVAWRDSNHVYARRATTAGWTGPEFQVDLGITMPPELWSSQYVALASDAAGGFVVAWRQLRSFVGDGFRTWEVGLETRRYDAAGAPLGPPTLIDQASESWTLQSAVSTGPASRTTFAWTSSPGQFACLPSGPWCEPPQVSQDGSGRSVYARSTANGSPVTNEFRVNTFTADDQQAPGVANDDHGNTLIVWQSPQDGSGTGIFGQRFGGLTPASLAVDPTPASGSNGNGVLEPGETATIAPAWRNATGASRAFTGAATSFGGPGGGGYGLLDPVADYGTVADGSIGSCSTSGNCYMASVSGPRPLTHWDASLTEGIAPSSLGQTASWSIHIGDSFVDVPQTSPFYPFVETLLHRGVTGGCASDAYCPASNVTREQLAPFVLAAREGTGYRPVPCGTPRFNDVPASSPFCRFIEELARRGVVGGCGGGNYCPGDPVTREQLPVFVLLTLEPTLEPPACGTPLFADVPASSPFCRFIEELARRGVVAGCGGGDYCPSQPVSREQMAVFISAGFGLTLYGP